MSLVGPLLVLHAPKIIYGFFQKTTIAGHSQREWIRLRNHLKIESHLQMITQAVSRGQKGKEAALIECW
jgi:hypothetical protein